ncbi:hypothetical protein FEP90_05674 [Burkholderia multivorans]|nr:hypothetical protein [Burkholderia multivorans]
MARALHWPVHRQTGARHASQGLVASDPGARIRYDARAAARTGSVDRHSQVFFDSRRDPPRALRRRQAPRHLENRLSDPRRRPAEPARPRTRPRTNEARIEPGRVDADHSGRRARRKRRRARREARQAVDGRRVDRQLRHASDRQAAGQPLARHRQPARLERHLQRRRESGSRTGRQAPRLARLERLLLDPVGLLDRHAFGLHEHVLPADRRREPDVHRERQFEDGRLQAEPRAVA